MAYSTSLRLLGLLALLAVVSADEEDNLGPDVIAGGEDAEMQKRLDDVAEGRALVYEKRFEAGKWYNESTEQVKDWRTFLDSIEPVRASYITLSGSTDRRGITCADFKVVQKLAHALHYRENSKMLPCNGYFWMVQHGCVMDDNFIEKSVYIEAWKLGQAAGGCNCGNGDTTKSFIIRPDIGNHNWGSINGPRCNPGTQTLHMQIGEEYTPGHYKEDFTAGMVYGAAHVQYRAWQAFLDTLQPAKATNITIFGSRDATGIMCDDPAAVLDLTNSLYERKNSMMHRCHGKIWVVQAGCVVHQDFLRRSVYIEAYPQTGYGLGGCNCGFGAADVTNSYIVRPDVGNDNWGTVKGIKCKSISQRIEVFVDMGQDMEAPIGLPAN